MLDRKFLLIAGYARIRGFESFRGILVENEWKIVQRFTFRLNLRIFGNQWSERRPCTLKWEEFYIESM